MALGASEESRFIRPRNKNQPINHPNPRPTCSTLLSSIFSSSSTKTSNTHNAPSGLSKFTLLAFSKLGCGSVSPASMPEVILSAADWEAKKVKRRRKKKTTSSGSGNVTSPVGVEVVSDVFCAPPGIDAAFVDCVEPRRPISRRKHRKKMMSQGRVPLESVLEEFDQFGELRLDVDNMSYEELVDLSEKMGCVGTGLREEKILACLRNTDLETIPLLLDQDCKCSICRDEYEADDQVGKLDCGHCYHVGCIKPWLLRNNSCPICKAAAHN